MAAGWDADRGVIGVGQGRLPDNVSYRGIFPVGRTWPLRRLVGGLSMILDNPTRKDLAPRAGVAIIGPACFKSLLNRARSGVLGYLPTCTNGSKTGEGFLRHLFFAPGQSILLYLFCHYWCLGTPFSLKYYRKSGLMKLPTILDAAIMTGGLLAWYWWVIIWLIILLGVVVEFSVRQNRKTRTRDDAATAPDRNDGQTEEPQPNSVCPPGTTPSGPEETSNRPPAHQSRV